MSGNGKRVVSIWLPRWAINLAERQADELRASPFALVEQDKNALHLHGVNQTAEKRGLTRGMSLTDARGAVPDLVTHQRQPLREQNALRALHRWCYRYTPWAALDGEDGILLDITGCAHLFGGEEALVDHLSRDLKRLAIDHRLAIADTKGAAHIAARFGGCDRLLIPPGKSRQVISGLSINALCADKYILRRLGLKTLGDAAALPRAELAKRFGIAMTTRLEEALGERAIPITPLAPEERFSVRISFPEPIGLRTDIDAALEKLLNSLCARLGNAGRGAKLIILYLTESDGKTHTLQVGMARPCHQPAPILRQFGPLLDKVDVGFGLDRLRLWVSAHEAHVSRQLTTHEKDTPKDALTDLVGRLGNKLGFDRITQPCPTDTHLPERRVQHTPVVEIRQPINWQPEQGGAPLRLGKGRPLRALTDGRPPPQFSFRGTTARLTTSKGPRRIAGEWWQKHTYYRQFRDYWSAELDSGERLWLRCDFSTGDKRHWYVEGVLP